MTCFDGALISVRPQQNQAQKGSPCIPSYERRSHQILIIVQLNAERFPAAHLKFNELALWHSLHQIDNNII